VPPGNITFLAGTFWLSYSQTASLEGIVGIQ
jgi:hypothetical protein